MSNYLCSICNGTVRKSDKAVCCDHCDKWVHIRCNDLNSIDYEYLKCSSEIWFCKICSAEIFPFCTDSNPTITENKITCDKDLQALLNELNKLTEDSESGNDLQIPNCRYLDIDYFCNLEKTIKINSLSLFHLNVCSLAKTLMIFTFFSQALNWILISLVSQKLVLLKILTLHLILT